MKPSKINCSFRKCIGVMFLLVLLRIFLIKVKICPLKKITDLTSCLRKIIAAVKVDLTKNFRLAFQLTVTIYVLVMAI